MKPSFFVMALLICTTTFAQTKPYKPEIKSGLIMEYEIIAQGGAIPLIMRVASVSNAEIIFDFDFMGGTTGKFVNTKSNLDKGGNLNWDAPVLGEERRLVEDQTLGMVSRPFLKDLKATKKATYDGMNFTAKPVPEGDEITIAGKPVDLIYAENESGSTRMWILNNDSYPVLLKITGTPAGIDMIVKSIK